MTVIGAWKKKGNVKTGNGFGLSDTYNDLVPSTVTLRSEQDEQPNISDNSPSKISSQIVSDKPPSKRDKEATESPDIESKTWRSSK